MRKEILRNSLDKQCKNVHYVERRNIAKPGEPAKIRWVYLIGKVQSKPYPTYEKALHAMYRADTLGYEFTLYEYRYIVNPKYRE